MISSLLTYCRNFIQQHKTIVENASYMMLLQVFLMLAPLITYPYLVRVLGMETYGWVLTAQMLASYFSIIIDFGSNSVCAKHVALAKDNNSLLSEIVCSVFYTRFFIAFVGFFVYLGIVLLVPSYREHLLLFMLSYGMTFNELFFPQYFYQGIEKMKLIAITNVVIKALFIALIFVVIHQPEDYICVPVFYTIGYGVAGIIALFFIFHKLSIPFSRPNKHAMIKYAKDSFSILATDIICTIKDKINYLLVGAYIGADSVVVYDLGLKLNTVLIQPYSIIKTVLFPRSAQTRNIQKIKTSIVAVFTITVVCVVLTEIFLQPIAAFFIGDDTIDLLPIRLLLIAPIILSVSVPIASNVCIALGYNKYVFYSILVTTGAYVIVLAGLALTDQLNSILSFVLLALIAYLVELIYRLFVFRRIAKEEQLKQSNKDISSAQ